jgi:hypothetical protein
VEHVIEVLRRWPAIPPGVLALQSSQLADAGDKFAASAASITSSLGIIAQHVSEMAEESRTLSGFSEIEQNSCFLPLEQACSAFLVRLGLCAEAEAANEATHTGLAETIGQMRGAIQKIQAVEIQMVRLALNASIRAAHIGGSGDALAVLAGTMQRVASECGGRTDSLMQSLHSMSRTSATLSVRCPSAKSGHCQETMRPALAELRSSIERSFASSSRILTRTTRLREDLSSTLEGFSVGPVFAQAVARASEILDGIASQQQHEFVPLTNKGGEPGLNDFAQHYTMQAERDVHAVATRTVQQRALGGAHVQQSEFLSKSGGEVADNVEFF